MNRSKNHQKIVHGSFRDPSGFLFYQGDSIYRQINTSYKDNYDLLMSSGLYKKLVDDGLLIHHKEIKVKRLKDNAIIYKIIKPELIPFISYPYEWSFSQLKNAALTTLEIHKRALDHGMALKDSSAYNIQFYKGKPVLIDTLSFEKYQEGQPWVAYKQFCQHFLVPLALMSYKDVRLNKLSSIFLDGIPLDLASSLLPWRARLSFSLLTHIYLHAKSQKYFSDKRVKTSRIKLSKYSVYGLVDNLEHSVRKLKWKPCDSEWAEYYQIINYSSKAFQYKKQIIGKFLEKIKPKMVWDIGANMGMFSQIAAQKKILTISLDIDPAAVEKNYLECIGKKETNILPLLIDLTNPSPPIGWENNERYSLNQRGPVDMVFALALIHHLVISNNLPLNKIANFFSKICSSLIIEFVPKTDSQVQKLLKSRKDIFSDYTQVNFENKFKNYYKIVDSFRIPESKRRLYIMKKVS